MYRFNTIYIINTYFYIICKVITQTFTINFVYIIKIQTLDNNWHICLVNNNFYILEYIREGMQKTHFTYTVRSDLW